MYAPSRLVRKADQRIHLVRASLPCIAPIIALMLLAGLAWTLWTTPVTGSWNMNVSNPGPVTAILPNGSTVQAPPAELTYTVYLPSIAKRYPLIPNDPSYSLQWGLPKVNAPQAWGKSTGSGIVIAVVDTGVDLDHPDLAGKIVSGWNFVNGNNNPQDDEGHGSHVAGIAAAMTNNSIGVAGLGWDAQIMPVKVLDYQGSGYESWVANGVQWAADHGAKVINLSLGSPSYSALMQTATDYAFSHGALVVAAAGNCGDPNPYYNPCYPLINPTIYPAANPNVLAVGATTSSDARASFSSYGSFVDVAAPGYSIYSTLWNNTYGTESGTSMASPLVAGLASLVWARNPALSNAQAANAIMNSAVDLGTAGRDNEYGYGRVDAAAAVAAALLQSQAVSMPDGKSASAVSAPLADAPVRPGVVLVRFKRGIVAATQQELLTRLNLQVTGRLEELDVFELSVPSGQERDMASQLTADPSVEFAEPDYVVRAY